MSEKLALATEAEKKALAAVQQGAEAVSSIQRVVAFGSRVRGDFNGDSDLDLLVLVRSISAKDDVVRFLYSIETEFDVPLAPVIYTVAEYEHNRALRSSFVQNVEKEGVILYDAERTGKR
jgi:uncharacterized protein